jgi:hypothetical protein
VYVLQVLDLAAPKKYMQIRDWHVESCGSGQDGLELQNVQVYNNKREEEIVGSGIVNVKTFLSAPITVRFPQYFSETCQSSSICWEL